MIRTYQLAKNVNGREFLEVQVQRFPFDVKLSIRVYLDNNDITIKRFESHPPVFIRDEVYSVLDFMQSPRWYKDVREQMAKSEREPIEEGKIDLNI